MPEKIYIQDVAQYEGKEVKIPGWVYNKTGKGKLVFIMLRDGTGTIQAVIFKGNVDEAIFEQCKELTQESSIIVTGTVSAEPRAKGGFELQASHVEIVDVADEYPISPKEQRRIFASIDGARSKLEKDIVQLRAISRVINPNVMSEPEFLAMTGIHQKLLEQCRLEAHHMEDQVNYLRQNGSPTAIDRINGTYSGVQDTLKQLYSIQSYYEPLTEPLTD